MSNKNIERRIVIGLISSSAFIKEIREIYSSKFLKASMAKRLASWCVDYYDKYQKAPGMDIEGIYFEKLKKGLPKEIGEEIEEEILPNLNEEYLDENLNVDYLIDQTKDYFAERHLSMHSEQIVALLNEGELVEAAKLATNYKPVSKNAGNTVDFSEPAILTRVEAAFAESQSPLIKFPKQLGLFLNPQMVRTALLAFMAKEKTGKSYLLMELITRAVKQKRKVAFFQAGDMSEGQQIRRFCVHLAKKSNLEKYAGKMTQPCRDCIHNQRDTCEKDIRECDFGVFEDKTVEQIRNEMTYEELKEVFDENPDYKPCYNCKEYVTKPWGAVWMENIDVGKPLTVKEATNLWEDYFINSKRQVKMSTHPNGTLTIPMMNSIMDLWETTDGFIPDIIVLDYADLCEDDSHEFRHKQNNIWKGLRAMSQKRHALTISVTQTDADSYERNLLSMKNFSEDKRKFAHVTAMYGMNQDPKGREKKLGILRLNELAIREGDFNNANVCYVLQNLRRGLPYVGSYF